MDEPTNDESFPILQGIRAEKTMLFYLRRVVRKIFRPKTYEVTGGRRKLENEELHNSSPSKIRMIESRTVVGTEHVAHTRGKRNAKIFWRENQKN